MKAKLDAYFGSHFLLFVAKEIIVGLAQIVWAIVEFLFWTITAALFFGVVVPVLRVTGLEQHFKRFVVNLSERKRSKQSKKMFLALKQKQAELDKTEINWIG